jgi:hypothetical protein
MRAIRRSCGRLHAGSYGCRSTASRGQRNAAGAGRAHARSYQSPPPEEPGKLNASPRNLNACGDAT